MVALIFSRKQAKAVHHLMKRRQRHSPHNDRSRDPRPVPGLMQHEVSADGGGRMERAGYLHGEGRKADGKAGREVRHAEHRPHDPAA